MLTKSIPGATLQRFEFPKVTKAYLEELGDTKSKGGRDVRLHR